MQCTVWSNGSELPKEGNPSIGIDGGLLPSFTIKSNSIGNSLFFPMTEASLLRIERPVMRKGLLE
jgi:hypothetical protein